MTTPETRRPRTGNPSEPLADHARQFYRDEDGAAAIFILFFSVMLIMVAGIGADVMRHEMERAKLQATLDSAVLAGAGAPDGADPKAIVQDYFTKNNMGEYLDAFDEDDVITTLASTKVSASASMSMNTYLMKLAGVDTLTANGQATAEMRVPNLEVVLVLDVSGSMASNNKIDNLKIAAKDFVSTIMDSSMPDSTVISVVPFSTSVTPSDNLYAELATNDQHLYSTCVYLEENDYSHPALATGGSSTSEGDPLRQSIYTSLYGDFDALDEPGAPRDWRSCYTEEYMRILPYSVDKATLHAKIDSFVAMGNTSTDQGIKFASALLNPRFREVSAGLIAKGDVEASQAHVPADYDAPETLKVMIVMGDGQNTTTYFFDKSPSAYRGANSDLYHVTYQEQVFDYAYRKRNKDRRYYHSWYESMCSNNRWRCEYKAQGDVKSVYYLRDPDPTDRNWDGVADEYYNIQQDEWLSRNEFRDIPETLQGFISSERLDWEQAWGLMSPHFYGRITGNWGPWNDYVGSEYISGATKNRRMTEICNTAKNEGVYIYSIGFEIAEGGTAESQLKTCASSTAHYFRAEGINITDAFSAIAKNVQHLRLTQ